MYIPSENLHMAQELKNIFIFKDEFMWPSVNGNVLTNKIDIQSGKTHEVTRCKQALSVTINMKRSLSVELTSLHPLSKTQTAQ